MLGPLIEQLPFKPLNITHLLDPSGHYVLNLDPEFPLIIQSCSYDAPLEATPLNWHEHLEIFVPISGSGVFRVGAGLIPFTPGDMLVVDNLKLHGLHRFDGPRRRAIVIRFAPELIYQFNSPLCDYLYLTPFYCREESTPPIIPTAHRLAPALRGAFCRLLSCYFNSTEGLGFQVGCKTHLIELLHVMTKYFGYWQVTPGAFQHKRSEAQRLGILHEYLRVNYGEKIDVSTAAGIIGMAPTNFMKPELCTKPGLALGRLKAEAIWDP